MKKMSISDFKTHALRYIKSVYTEREKIIITKRGIPVAEVIPYENPVEKPQPGKLANALVSEKDIVTPLGSGMWESCS